MAHTTPIKKSVTICAKCKHFEPDECAYWSRCKASTLHPAINFITGESGYAESNNPDRTYITDSPYEYCSEINTHGTCPKFERKEK